jgi:LacI family transcriptional regulator
VDQKKPARPRLIDVAKLAGVGTATVDRVLNERGNVSEEVRLKVIEAARSVGLRRQLPPSYRPRIRINLILARPDLPLLEKMAAEFRSLAKSIDRRVGLQITTLVDERPESIATALKVTDCDAVIVYAQNNSIIRDAIAELELRDIPVVTIISDLHDSKRLAYAGTDHYASGRTAGYFIGQMRPQRGHVAVLCNHLGFESHARRIAGLRDYLGEHAPHLSISHIIEGADDRVRSRALLSAAFEEDPKILAVYNVGAANLGVRAALKAIDPSDLPLFVGHELTVHTTRLLREGLMTLAIDQNPRLQAQFAFDILLDHFGFESIPIKRPYVSDVPIILYGPENIPPS